MLENGILGVHCSKMSSGESRSGEWYYLRNGILGNGILGDEITPHA